MGVPLGEREGCAAARMWRGACGTLVAPGADDAWKQIVDSSPPDAMWHSLRNCVAYQAGVWSNLLTKGIDDVIQPAAFKLAIVLRHTPSELVVRLLTDLLRLHPQSQDLTSYVLALLTDDEAQFCGSCGRSASPSAPAAPAPLRDLQLFGDCELAGIFYVCMWSQQDLTSYVLALLTDDEAQFCGSCGRSASPSAPAAPAPLRDLQLFGDCELAGIFYVCMWSQQDLTSYVLALLTDDEAQFCGSCGRSASPSAPAAPAPLRDLQLFGDCELAGIFYVCMWSQQDLTSYVLALLTDDEAQFCGSCGRSASPSAPAAPAPLRDLQLFGDCELAGIFYVCMWSQQDLTSYVLALLTDDEAQFCGSCGRSASPSAPAAPAPLRDLQLFGDCELAGIFYVCMWSQQDLTSYVLALLTDDEAQFCGSCGRSASPSAPAAPAPLRDLQLFGDCELAVLAASKEEYDAHAKLVRAEYSKLTQENYVELRIKVLNQFSQIPKLYHTPEFECFESAARENIEREICTLREHLLTGRKD